MPVSKPGTIDSIGTDPQTGVVALSMFEERDWGDPVAHLRDLERKVNGYLDFVFGGQMNENPEYRGKLVEIELYCQFIPPQQVAPVFRTLKLHLQAQHIGFKVFVGPNRTCPLTI